MDEKKGSFIFFHEWDDLFQRLAPEQCKELILSMIAYDRDGSEYIGDDDQIRLSMLFICKILDRTREKYEKRCEKNRAAIQKRWENAKAYERIQTYTNVSYSDSESDSRSESESGSDSRSESESESLYMRDRKKEKRKKEGTISEAIALCERSFPEWKLSRMAVTSACLSAGADTVIDTIKAAKSGHGQEWLSAQLKRLSNQ